MGDRDKNKNKKHPRQEYTPSPEAENFQKNYWSSVLNNRVGGFVTPYTDLTRGGKNCISGVCDASSTFGGLDIPIVPGNETWQNVKGDYGYYTVNVDSPDDLLPGDQIHYMNTRMNDPKLSKKAEDISTTKINKHIMSGADYDKLANMYRDSLNTGFIYRKLYKDKYGKEPGSYPFHTSLFGGKKTTPNGVRYIMHNNAGQEDMRRYERTFDEQIRNFETGDRGITVSRYDPKYAKRQNFWEDYTTRMLSGDNEFSSMYQEEAPKKQEETLPKIIYPTTKYPIINKGEESGGDIYNMQNYYTQNKNKYGKHAMVKPEVLDAIAQRLEGIYKQEYAGGDGGEGASTRYLIKSMIPDAAMPYVRQLHDNISSEDESGYKWYNLLWDKNLDNVRDRFKTEKEWTDYVAKNYGNGKQKKTEKTEETLLPKTAGDLLKDFIINANIKYSNAPRSRGRWQQKKLSKRGELYGGDIKSDDLGKQFDAAIGLFLDNFEIAKKKYPDLTDEQLIDVATLMHASPYKANIPEYVYGLLMNGMSKYVNKTKQLVNMKRLGGIMYKKGGKSGIHIKPENRGKFTEYCGGEVTEKCIQKGKNSSDPAVRKRATFAKNARSWGKNKGGILYKK